MAYLYVRHRGKHLLPVGVLVLCNEMEHFSCSAPAGLSGASPMPMVQARPGEHRCGARGSVAAGSARGGWGVSAWSRAAPTIKS